MGARWGRWHKGKGKVGELVRGMARAKAGYASGIQGVAGQRQGRGGVLLLRLKVAINRNQQRGNNRTNQVQQNWNELSNDNQYPIIQRTNARP